MLENNLENRECNIDFKSMTREQLASLMAAGAKNALSGSDMPSFLSNMELMAEAGNELMSRPTPLPSIVDHARRLPLRLAIAIQRAHADGRWVIDQETDTALDRLALAAMSNPALQSLLAGVNVPGGHPVSANAPVQNHQAQSMPEQAHIVDVSTRSNPPTEFRFLDAIEWKYRQHIDRGGPEDKNASDLKLRARYFTALMGNPLIAELTNEDFRNFANQISFLPAQIARTGEWTEATLKDIIVANGYVDRSNPELQDKISKPTKIPISEKTLKEKTLGPLRSSVLGFASEKGLPISLQSFNYRVPRHTPEGQPRKKPPEELVRAALDNGFEDGRLLQMMLPVLLCCTGRRLSQVAFMCGNSIQDFEGHYLATVQGYIEINGRSFRCPIKTDEAKTPFVLPDKLKEIGFIDFCRSKGDRPIFESIFVDGVVRPDGTAQKRLAKLTKGAKVDMVIHQLRHLMESRLSVTQTKEKFQRMQQGHAPASDHEQYSWEWEKPIVELYANMDWSTFIDWEKYQGVDFKEAEIKCLGKAKRHQKGRLKLK